MPGASRQNVSLREALAYDAASSAAAKLKTSVGRWMVYPESVTRT
jgi:hypothetical protein